jgi:hypothetical protein
MSYRITLSYDERMAIDWVGGRYHSGTPLRNILEPYMTADLEWCDNRDITFHLPEHAAWEIGDMAETFGHRWDCLSGDFNRKLNDFCDSIV